MSTINAKLLHEVYAALLVAEQELFGKQTANHDAYKTVMYARTEMRYALNRLPPVVVSVTEPESVPEFLAAAV